VKKILIAVPATLLVLYLAACTYMYVRQRALVFEPSTVDVATEVDSVPHAENVVIDTADGEHLKAWWVAPEPGRPIYLYLHGNAGNLRGSFSNPTGRAERYTALTQAGAGLLALSWRGYGGSSGTPSESGFRTDAESALNWLQQKQSNAAVIVFGESLGTGIAVQLAAAHDFAAVVLDSPYTAIADVGAERYPWLPVRLLSKDPFDSLAYAGKVTEPVRIQHCTQDRVVPYAQGQHLFASLASTDKQFRSVEGVCHVPSILPALAEFRALEQRFTRTKSEAPQSGSGNPSQP